MATVFRTACFLACLVTAHGRFVVESGSLKITNPSSIRGSYTIALANFGVPLYGAELRGAIVYPESTGNIYGCTSTDHPTGFEEDFRFDSPPGYATIVMLKRGGCMFTEKVINAQLHGADAVLIGDNTDEPLITMDAAGDIDTLRYLKNITVPAALLTQSDSLKIIQQIQASNLVVCVIDWSEALPHPDDKVEWELWTNMNNGCGDKCRQTSEFVKAFTPFAKQLEQGGYTTFVPHFLTWHCMEQYQGSYECRKQCLTNGSYCAPDPDTDFEHGYDGRDVVAQNLNSLCVFQAANETGSPWLWWEYMSQFDTRCTMDSNTFNTECAHTVAVGLGLNLDSIVACAGNLDDDHPILDLEQQAQLGAGGRGDVTINPTIMVNDRQYRGKFEENSVLTAICAGFDPLTEPDICLNPGVSNDECAYGKVGFDECNSNTDGRTRCVETFRGFECECPEGLMSYKDAEGNPHCEDENECRGSALELDSCNCDRCVCQNLKPSFKCETIENRCEAEPHVCWVGGSASACVDNIAELKIMGANGKNPLSIGSFTCQCPTGYEGDGTAEGSGCADIDECKRDVCKEGTCKNTEGSYECSCHNGGIYDRETDTCGVGEGSTGDAGLAAGWVILIVLAAITVCAIAGYGLYKYRLKSYMDAEIRAIMAQYMPLDKETMDQEGVSESPAENAL